MVLGVHVIDVRRDEAHAAVVVDAEVRGQPLEPLRLEHRVDVGRAGPQRLVRGAVDRAPVYDGPERRVDGVEDLAVRPWVPVLLCIGYGLERGDSRDEFGSQ